MGNARKEAAQQQHERHLPARHEADRAEEFDIARPEALLLVPQTPRFAHESGDAEPEAEAEEALSGERPASKKRCRKGQRRERNGNGATGMTAGMTPRAASMQNAAESRKSAARRTAASASERAESTPSTERDNCAENTAAMKALSFAPYFIISFSFVIALLYAAPAREKFRSRGTLCRPLFEGEKALFSCLPL